MRFHEMCPNDTYAAQSREIQILCELCFAILHILTRLFPSPDIQIQIQKPTEKETWKQAHKATPFLDPRYPKNF